MNVDPLTLFVGTIMPYISLTVLIVGLLYEMAKWLRTPVPLKIPVTPAPKTYPGVLVRVTAEILLFRTFWRGSRKLWVGSYTYHLALWTIILDKMFLFIPPAIAGITAGALVADFRPFLRAPLFGKFIAFTGIILSAALVYLLFRRLAIPALKYASRASDYLILFLIMGVALTGTYMRVFTQVNVDDVSTFIQSLGAFKPIAPPADPFFLFHFFLVQSLMIYVPFSKVVHLIGAIFSPTKNQRNNPRDARFKNPWDYEVKIEPWEEYAKKFQIEETEGK